MSGAHLALPRNHVWMPKANEGDRFSLGPYLGKQLLPMLS